MPGTMDAVPGLDDKTLVMFHGTSVVETRFGGGVVSMSISVEYAFNTDLALPELSFEISRRLGCVLEPDPDEPQTLFIGGLFGMQLTLWTQHGLINDRE